MRLEHLIKYLKYNLSSFNCDAVSFAGTNMFWKVLNLILFIYLVGFCFAANLMWHNFPYDQDSPISAHTGTRD